MTSKAGSSYGCAARIAARFAKLGALDGVTAIPPDFDWHSYHSFTAVDPAHDPARPRRQRSDGPGEPAVRVGLVGPRVGDGQAGDDVVAHPAPGPPGSPQATGDGVVRRDAHVEPADAPLGEERTGDLDELDTPSPRGPARP